MSVTLRVRLEGGMGKAKSQLPTSGQDFWPNRKLLDKVTKAAGAPSLFTFIHSLGEEDEWAYEALGSPDTDDMDEDEEDRFDAKLERMAAKVGKWHKASDGLKSVDALLAHLDAKGRDAIPGVLDDLKALRKLLLTAQKSKKGFRLAGE